MKNLEKYQRGAITMSPFNAYLYRTMLKNKITRVYRNIYLFYRETKIFFISSKLNPILMEFYIWSHQKKLSQHVANCLHAEHNNLYVWENDIKCNNYNVFKTQFSVELNRVKQGMNMVWNCSFNIVRRKFLFSRKNNFDPWWIKTWHSNCHKIFKRKALLKF